MPHSNLEQLYETARQLRPIMPDLVFVVGSVTSILVTVTFELAT
jgi:hypothetical protein